MSAWDRVLGAKLDEVSTEVKEDFVPKPKFVPPKLAQASVIEPSVEEFAVAREHSRPPDQWLVDQHGQRVPMWYESAPANPWQPKIPTPNEQMSQFVLWRLLSKFIPKGYGTYVAVAVWIAINIAAAMGYTVPGFELIQGNEGAGINLGLALAYLRRAIG